MLLSREEVLGGLSGGVLAGLLVVVVLQVGAGEFLEGQATVYGLSATGPTTWGIFLVHSLALAAVYTVVMGVGTDPYLTWLLGLTRRSPAAARAIKPLMDRFGISVVVATLTGVQFGLFVWLVLAVGLLPTVEESLPRLDAVVLLGGLLYGTALGAVYGKTLEQ